MNIDILLNWDHEVIPTPRADLLANLKTHIHNHMGWKKVCVNFENEVLTVEVLQTKQLHLSGGLTNVESERTLLSLRCGHIPNELYGRSAHLCFNKFELSDAVLQAA